MARTPVVDQQKCIGCGACAGIASKTFKVGDNGKSSVLPPPNDEETVIESAIDSCPVQAISWKP